MGNAESLTHILFLTIFVQPYKEVRSRRTFFRTPTRAGLPTVIGLDLTDIL